MDKKRIQELLADIEREERQTRTGGTTTATPDYEQQTHPHGNPSSFEQMSTDDLLRLIALLILAEDHGPIVESGPITVAQEAAEPLEETAPTGKRHYRLTTGWIALIAVVSLLLASTGTFFVMPLFHQEATVTITATEKTVSTTAQLTAAPGTHIAQALQAHFLAPVSQTLTTTVTTTGTGHQNATPGRGTITFYNGLPQAQTIAAQTVLTGGDGIQVVTDQVITVPAAILPTEGIATVSAHTLAIGPQANIRGNDIHGPCCLQNILAYNSPFYGGLSEREYHTATASDIDSATQAVKTQVAQSVQHTITSQLHPSEALLPLQCSFTSSPNHHAGDEAAQVTVTAQETCKAGVYDQTAVPTLTTPLLQEEASKQFGPAYHLQGEAHTVITQATIDNATITIKTSVSGTYQYLFSSTDVQHLQAQISHLSKAQAYQLLKQTPGISNVHITANQDTLPQDMSAIHIIVL